MLGREGDPLPEGGGTPEEEDGSLSLVLKAGPCITRRGAGDELLWLHSILGHRRPWLHRGPAVPETRWPGFLGSLWSSESPGEQQKQKHHGTSHVGEASIY